jgi:glycosyltransferase involved in cell wall biosynthesis
VLDTVIDGKTGIFFQEQSVTSFNNAIEEFEANEDQFDRWQIRRQAESFSREIFMDKIKSFINQSMEIHRKGENGELPEEIKREYREN